MLRAPDPTLWTGRSDPEDGSDARRWHNVVQCVAPDAWATLDAAPRDALAIVGFASDAGVVRNKGRAGAAEGPDAIRRALAGTAWHAEVPVYDVGTVVCEGDALEDAQDALAEVVADLTGRGLLPLIFGGGHEVAWGTWQGLVRAEPSERVAVVNLDAHLDLRLPQEGRGTSGTPFFQISADCEARGWPFSYACIGAAPTSNTAALFQRAQDLGVAMTLDVAANADPERALRAAEVAVADAPRLQLSLCLDVLPAAVAPGVSAPAAFGVQLGTVLGLLGAIARDRRVAAIEIAELNPRLDLDGRTARVAARCCHAVAMSRTALRRDRAETAVRAAARKDHP